MAHRAVDSITLRGGSIEYKKQIIIDHLLKKAKDHKFYKDHFKWEANDILTACIIVIIVHHAKRYAVIK